ncbi:WD repeat-containing protein 13-like [Styela clava]
MNVTVWQQVLGQDARYSAYRTPSDPQFRTQYLRRRSQLLRENAKKQVPGDPNARKQYLKIRSKLLAQKYGPVSEASSLRSVSIRGSITTLDRIDSSTEDKNEINSRINPEKSSIVVPTQQAEASRALVGGKSIAENYAFAGVHHIFDCHLGSPVTTIKFANDDKNRIAFASADGMLSVCHLQPKPEVEVTLKGHTSEITDFAWSLSNDLIVTASKDTTLRLWDTSSGRCIRVVAEIRTAPINCCAFQPMNNNLVVAGDGTCLVNVYNISTGKVTKGGTGKLGAPVISIAFDSTGNILWAGDSRGTLHSFTFDLATSRLRKGHKVSLRAETPITSIQARSWISREARDPSVLVNIAVNTLCLFRVTDNKGLVQLRKTFTIRHRNHRIRSVFCPLMSFRQGACVITGNEDMTVCFFDVEKSTKSCVNRLQGHSAPVLDVSFNYDESLLASCDAEGLVIIWRREL